MTNNEETVTITLTIDEAYTVAIALGDASVRYGLEGYPFMSNGAWELRARVIEVIEEQTSEVPERL